MSKFVRLSYRIPGDDRSFLNLEAGASALRLVMGWDGYFLGEEEDERVVVWGSVEEMEKDPKGKHCPRIMVDRQ